MKRLKIAVDYNTIGDHEQGWIRLNTGAQPILLTYLHPGLPLILFDEESLEVDAVAAYDADYDFWYGVADWSTRRDLPQLNEDYDHSARFVFDGDDAER